MVYEKIIELCKQKGLSIRSLEDKAEISHGSIRAWKTAAPSAYSLHRVSKILGVKMEKLLGA